MYCTQCGKQLPEKAKFCARCGKRTVENPEQSSASQEIKSADKRSPAARTHPDDLGEKRGKYDKKSPPKVSLLSVFLAVIGLILILVLLNPWHEAKAPPPDFNPTSGNSNAVQPAINAQVLEIAEKFNCPCGACNDILSECDCTNPNGAQEVKTFILKALQQGNSQQQVIRATAAKYGHLREQSS